MTFFDKMSILATFWHKTRFLPTFWQRKCQPFSIPLLHRNLHPLDRNFDIKFPFTATFWQQNQKRCFLIQIFILPLLFARNDILFANIFATFIWHMCYCNRFQVLDSNLNVVSWLLVSDFSDSTWIYLSSLRKSYIKKRVKVSCRHFCAALSMYLISK